MATLLRTLFFSASNRCCVIRLILLVVALAAQGRGADTASAQQVDVRVAGRVTTTDGQGIAGAIVEWGSDGESFEQRQRTATDENGNYTMALESPGGRNRLAASALGYQASTDVAQIGRGAQTRDFTLTKQPETGRAVSGQVLDEQNRPIEGVRVEAFTPVVGFASSFSMPTGRDYFPGPDRVDVTDEQGRFSIIDLPSDQVQLNLRSNYRHINDANHPVKEGLKIVMRGSGRQGVIQARVVDATTGLPILPLDDVRVVRRYSPTSHKFSSEDGRFVLPSDAQLGRTYIVYVYAPAYAAAEARVTAVAAGSSEFVDIKLKERPTLRGRLVDADGERPIAGAAVMYGIADGASYIEWGSFDQYADGYHSFQRVQHEPSSESGEFWFAEPESGPLGTIVVLASGYQRLILRPDQRQIDDGGRLVIRLKRESAVTGVVLKNGKPLPDATVSVGGPSPDGLHHMYESVRSDAQGRYKYGRLTPGTYRVSGGSYSRTVTVGEGETAQVNLGEDLGPIRIFGSASPSITISLSPEFDWEYTGFETAANFMGEYEFLGLKPGKYKASMHYAYPTGYISRSERAIQVESDGQRIDLQQLMQ